MTTVTGVPDGYTYVVQTGTPGVGSVPPGVGLISARAALAADVDGGIS
ncbi:hypothetical protein KIH74_17555 [Kineosporia sp. J2-2]|uniref:Uncharacterized protein n=1 Tax=Kineosporia corallincola TaxID=2835133 RepID=A0ABS5TMC8_9ACTN|nr:hypothetical protein [Kineosporia corallincola]MBT0770754.1 hypothetical protein [Kineosporia corallincola]